MQNMQENRPLRQIMQIRNAPMTIIQYTTKTTTKILWTTTTKEQPTGNETNITKDEKHKRRRNRRHTGDNRRNNRSRINVLHTGNDGRLAKHKLYAIGKTHRGKCDRHHQNKKTRILDTNKNQQQTNLMVTISNTTSPNRKSRKRNTNTNRRQPNQETNVLFGRKLYKPSGNNCKSRPINQNSTRLKLTAQYTKTNTKCKA